MAHLKHKEYGTEIEVPDELAATFTGPDDGWEVSDDAGHHGTARRSRSTRKAADS